MKSIKAIVLGAGGRGQFTYGEYALQNPQDLKIVAVAEPDDGRRDKFAKDHNLKKENVFKSWEEALSKEKFADLVCVCTQDRMHYEPAMKALELGYDLLLEKPIAPTLEECRAIADKAKEMSASVAIAHVLRYTPFYTTIKKIIDSKELGNIVGLDQIENVGHIHYSHSFVRGNWRCEEESTPMILAKSCHDLDIILFLTGGNCIDLSSYGSKGYFSSKNKPEGSPDRCLDGCPVRDTCPFYGPKIYLNGNTGWPTNILTTDLTTEGITKAFKEGPYGRCVFSCDNNMTEHQTVAMKFDNNVTATFTLSAFTKETTRTIKIMLENGEIVGDMNSDEISYTNYSTNECNEIKHIANNAEGHGGGDVGFMKDFINHLRDKEGFPLKTSIDIALQSHEMAFASHQAMLDTQNKILEK